MCRRTKSDSESVGDENLHENYFFRVSCIVSIPMFFQTRLNLQAEFVYAKSRADLIINFAVSKFRAR